MDQRIQGFNDGDSEAPTTWWIVCLTCVACTVCAFELMLTNLNQAYIVGTLGITPDEFTWLIATFIFGQFLGVALCLLLIKACSPRALLLGLCAAYSGFELMAAHAPDYRLYALSRLGAGFVNGAITTASLIFIIRKIPEHRRLLTYFLFSSPAIFVVPFSLIIGGTAIETYGWRSMYQWASVPGFLLCAALSLLVKRGKGRSWKWITRRIDFIGLFLLAFSALSYSVMMLRGTTENWLDSPFIQFLLMCNVFGWSAFFIQQLKRKRFHLIKTRLLCDPHIIGMASLNALYGVLLGYVLLVNGFLVLTQDSNSIQVGIAVAAAAICGPFIVAKIPKLDFRLLIILGALFCAASGLVNSNLTRLEDGYDLLVSQLLRSVGLTLFLWPLWNLIMIHTKTEEHDEAAKIYTFSRVIGVPAGIGLVGGLMLWRQNFHSEHLSEDLTNAVFHANIANMREHFLSTGSSAADAARQALIATAKHVRAESLVLSYGDAFWLFGVVAFLAVIPLLFVRSNTGKPSVFDRLAGRH